MQMICPESSREAAKECSPRRKPWVASTKRRSPEGAKERRRHPFRQGRPACTARYSLILLITFFFTIHSDAATKPHIITFRKWMEVNWIVPGDDKPISMRVRPLIIDARVKEYVTGAPHEVTERLFVVRRIFRVNDGLPEDSAPKWQWQRGGWLLIDRVTGRISPITLPEFDPFYSTASWYRDYVAYCGVSDDGKKNVRNRSAVGPSKTCLEKGTRGGCG